jgi:hypothetical protein
VAVTVGRANCPVPHSSRQFVPDCDLRTGSRDGTEVDVGSSGESRGSVRRGRRSPRGRAHAGRHG